MPRASSIRSCTTACGDCPVRGSVRPTGFIGPKARTSSPRSAITSMGRHPSKYLGSSNACGTTFSPALHAGDEGWYSSLFIGRLR